MKRFFTLSSRSCLPIIAKFTFDAATETCMPYMHTCLGTDNLYDSKAECIAKCNDPRALLDTSPPPGTAGIASAIHMSRIISD